MDPSYNACHSPIYRVRPDDVEDANARQTMQILIEKLEPTEEDVMRKFTEDELKELCLRVPCRVIGYFFNPVHKVYTTLELGGRFKKGRSLKTNRELVKKATLRIWEDIKPDEQKMKKLRAREWLMQKKDNILSLERWAYERENGLSDSLDMSKRMETIRPVGTGQSRTLYDSFHANLSSTNDNIFETQSEDIEEPPSQNLNNDGLSDELFNVNTESMSLTSVFSGPAQSQDILQNDSEDFFQNIPTTSTQSQDENNEDI